MVRSNDRPNSCNSSYVCTMATFLLRLNVNATELLNRHDNRQSTKSLTSLKVQWPAAKQAEYEHEMQASCALIFGNASP